MLRFDWKDGLLIVLGFGALATAIAGLRAAGLELPRSMIQGVAAVCVLGPSAARSCRWSFRFTLPCDRVAVVDPRHASLLVGGILLFTSACHKEGPVAKVPASTPEVTPSAPPPKVALRTSASINAEIEKLPTTYPHERIKIIHSLLEQPSAIAPHQLFILAYYLFHSGAKDEGLFWFYAAQLRGRADVNLYIDETARQVVTVLTMNVGEEIQPYGFSNLSRLSEIVERAVAWETVTPRDYDITWGVSHGMGAVREALRGEPSSDSPLLPKQEWDGIRKSTRDAYLAAFRELYEDLQKKRPQNATLRGDYPDPNSQEFIFACGREDAATVRRFLDEGADPSLQGKSGPTPLAAAFSGQRLENFELLLARGARVELPSKDPHAPDGILRTIIRQVRFRPDGPGADSYAFFERALQAQPTAAKLDSSLLHDAANVDDPRFVQLLLANGALPDQLHNGQGPLEQPFFSARSAAVLIDAGARKGTQEIARFLSDAVQREALCGPHSADEVAQKLEDYYRERTPHLVGFEELFGEKKKVARDNWTRDQADRAVLLAALARAHLRPQFTKEHPSHAPTKQEECDPSPPEPESTEPDPQSCKMVAQQVHAACTQGIQSERAKLKCDEQLRRLEETCPTSEKP